MPALPLNSLFAIPFLKKTIELFALLVEPETEFLVPDLFYIEMANISGNICGQDN